MYKYTQISMGEYCDQACENKAYLHIKFGLFFELLTFSLNIKYSCATEIILVDWQYI